MTDSHWTSGTARGTPDFATPPPDSLLRFRSEFPILETCTYLVSHSLGALPVRGRRALERYADEWNERGVRAWREGWWDLSLTCGDRIGRFLGAVPGTTSMQPNVTLATAVFLSALDFSGPRNRLVTTDLDFPSLLYLFDRGNIAGMEDVRVPSPDGVRIEMEDILKAIDERTRVVVVSHVFFRSSFVVDLARITKHAHEMGALVVADLYQSAGAIPVNLTELQVDAAVGGHLKWLLGGPGAAFLYVRPDLIPTLEPRLTGWFAHEAPFAFEPPPTRTHEGAGRFLTGTPNVSALRVAEASLEILEEAGIMAIREKSLALTRKILDRAAVEGWVTRSPLADDERGGTVSLDPPHAFGCSQALLARNVVIDYRPGAGIRMAPHFYNTADEIEHALDTLADILQSGAWRPFEEAARPKVT